MFNAELVSQNFGGQWIERTGLAKRDVDHNAALFADLFATRPPMLERFSAKVDDVGETPPFEAFSVVAPHNEVLAIVRGMRWTTNDLLRLELGYLNGEMGDPAVDDWAIVMPQVRSPKLKWTPNGQDYACVERSYIDTPSGGRFLAFSDPKHRLLSECIAGIHLSCTLNQSGEQLRKSRRGVLLLYPTKKKGLVVDVESTFMGIAVLPPAGPVTTLTRFKVRQPAEPDAVVVSVHSRTAPTPRKTRK
jgi:hypothetical protein